MKTPKPVLSDFNILIGRVAPWPPWPFFGYFDESSAFFDKKVQKLMTKYFQFWLIDSERRPQDMARPIVLFLAADKWASGAVSPFQSGSQFSFHAQGDLEFATELLHEVTRHYYKQKAKKPLQDIVIEYLGLHQKSHSKQGVKWDTIASWIWDEYKIHVKGDTLRASIVPHELSRRCEIMRLWQDNIEAYLESERNKYRR